MRRDLLHVVSAYINGNALCKGSGDKFLGFIRRKAFHGAVFEVKLNDLSHGQQMREIPGVTEKQKLTESDGYYLSPEFSNDKVVIKNCQNMFNSQDKSDKKV